MRRYLRVAAGTGSPWRTLVVSMVDDSTQKEFLCVSRNKVTALGEMKM